MIAAKVSLMSIRNPLWVYTKSERRSSSAARKLCLGLCRSKEDDNSSSEASQPQNGDLQKQELLAKIAMLQTQKVRLTDYLDERSAFLTQFAEEANSEIDAIGENALKDLDEASARIMENIESRMQAFEESVEMDREDTEKREKELEDFEGEIEKGRNEGMFFQSYKQKEEPIDKAKAREQVNNINLVTIQSVTSKTRKNIYIALIALLTLGIANSFLSTSDTPPDWRKLAVLAAIWVALVTRFTYEQTMLPKSDKNDGANKDLQEPK